MSTEGYSPKNEGYGENAVPENLPGSNLSMAEMREKLRAVIVNIDQLAEQSARDSAERSLTASVEQMKGISGFLKRIWTHTLARDYYRQIHLSRARQSVLIHKNIYAAELEHPVGKEAHEATATALVERFAQDYEETLHQGETRHVITHEGAEGLDVKGEIVSLMKEYASGKIGDDDFTEAKKQILHTVGRIEGSNKDDSMYADNLLEIARHVKMVVGHGASIDAVVQDLDIVVGKARDSIGTEAKHNVVDKAIEFAKKTPLGVLVNESTLASGVAIAAGVITGLSQRVASSRLATWGTFGATAVLSGGIIGYAENKRTKEDRSQHAREMAQGRSFEKGAAPRREEMEKYIHEMREAGQLAAAIREAKDDLTKLSAIADAEARIRLMDREKIDLLSYSDPAKVEKERLDLDMARAEAKAELRKMQGAQYLSEGKSLDDTLEQLIADRTTILTKGEGGIEERDKLFNKMKRGRVAWAALKGTAIGLTLGTAAQEATAFWNDQQTGFVEHLVKGKEADGGQQVVHTTWLEGLRRLATDSFSGGESGMPTVTENINTKVTAAQYLENHKLGTHIARDGWYDNDTPKPVFDKNELKLWWGGNKNTGIDANGNYVFSVKQMLPEGSYHKELSANAQELMKEGKLKMLLSLSQGTQAHPIEVSINPDGTAVIDPKSEVGKLFFAEQNGKAQFLGRYAEVAEMTGAKEGTEHVRILATHVGKGVDELTDVITKSIPREIPPVAPADYLIDPPPIIPIYGRAPLEPLGKGKNRPPKQESPEYPVYGYGEGSSIEGLWGEMEKMGVKPDTYTTTEVDGKKVWLDKEGRPVRRDVERERARVKSYLEAQEEVYVEKLKEFAKQVGPMNERCRVSVIIPANFEEKNLENLLDQYVQQVDTKGEPVDNDLFEINIIVNRKAGKPADKSMEVIEEWKKKNPGYHVNAIDIEFPEEKANVGTARKYITDLTLLRSVDRKRAEGPLYIESEDADLFSVDKRIVSKITRDFDEKPHLDILRGIQDRQPEVLQKNDLLFFERRLWDFMEALMRKSTYRPDTMQGSSFVWNRVISGGWNTAFTAESYAQIGGYVSDRMTEDMKIGWKISLLRGHKDAEGSYIPNTTTAATSGLRSNSSPRRFVDAMVRKVGVYEEFGSERDEIMKKMSLDELLDGVKSDAKAEIGSKDKYEQAMNTLRGFLKEQIKEPESQEVFERVLWAMGLRKDPIKHTDGTEERGDFTLKEGGFIQLTDKAMPRIISLLERYKKEKRSDWGYRRQNSPLKSESSKGEAIESAAPPAVENAAEPGVEVNQAPEPAVVEAEGQVASAAPAAEESAPVAENAPAAAEAAAEPNKAEKKEKKVIPIKEVREILKAELEKQNGVREVKKMEVAVQGRALQFNIEILTKVGPATMRGSMVNEKGKLVTKQLDTDANMILKSRIGRSFSEIGTAVQAYFEKEAGKPVSNIRISPRGLVVEFEPKAEVATELKQVQV